MQQRLSMVTLGVADMSRAKRFYLQGLGWTEVDQPSDEVCFIQLPSIILGLYGWDDLAADMNIESTPATPEFRGFSIAYNTSTPAETDEVMATAISAGATILKKAEKVFWGGYSGYFADPDGHAWEVAFNPYTLPSPDGSFVMAQS